MSRRTRDQERALHAYHCVAKLPDAQRKDYKICVQAFGSNVLRSGLAAALAFLARDGAPKDSAPGRFLQHLGDARIPGLAGSGEPLHIRVCNLELVEYQIATREVLQLAIWFRRAVQASIPDAPGADHA